MRSPSVARSFATSCIIATVLVLVGCGDGAGEDGAADNVGAGAVDDGSEAATSNPDDGVFRGTPEEYLAANRACFERNGIPTVDDPNNPSGFSVEPGGDDDLFFEVDALCREEVGAYTEESVPEDYLERIYEHALRQRECLIELGYDLPAAPTYEQFSQDRDFDPLGQTGATDQEFRDAEEACPSLQASDAERGASG
jgi:hypothetical protein